MLKRVFLPEDTFLISCPIFGPKKIHNMENSIKYNKVYRNNESTKFNTKVIQVNLNI